MNFKVSYHPIFCVGLLSTYPIFNLASLFPFNFQLEDVNILAGGSSLQEISFDH